MNICGKRIRIVNKIRFTITLFILFVAISYILMLNFNTVSGNGNIIYKDYIVSRGDTLWTIADVISSEDFDIREVVYHISEVNDIAGNEHIYPGQTIKIPVHEYIRD